MKRNSAQVSRLFVLTVLAFAVGVAMSVGTGDIRAEYSPSLGTTVTEVDQPLKKLVTADGGAGDETVHGDQCRDVECYQKPVYGYKWITRQRADGTSYFVKQRYIKYYRWKCKYVGPWYDC